MSLALAARLARRELRGGLKGFRVFLACLALGVAAVAAVGMVRAAIEAGLDQQGAVLLGGDAQMEFTYRFADAAEQAFMKAHAKRVSAVVDFQSMAVVGDRHALTQVKGVDGAYPLTGSVGLSPAMPLQTALAGANGEPGAVMQKALIEKLGLKLGDSFRLGTQSFRLMAVLTDEPDSATSGFTLGPRTIVATPALAASGLLVPGALFRTKYRLMLAPGADLAALKSQAEKAFRDKGMRWTDRRNAAPGIASFVRRIGSFLVLVGLAGLAVGGIGISAAVRAYIEGKTATIATLKTLGAEGRLIFAVYLMQAGALAGLGIVLGLALGAAMPLLLAPLLGRMLPFPAEFALYPVPLLQAVLYGALAALLFTLWPLARAQGMRAAALYRDDGRGHVPGPRTILAVALTALALVATAAWFSGLVVLTLWVAMGVIAALELLWLAAWALRRLARRLARSRALRGRTALRLALGAIGGPGGEAASVILSLGLGLSVLAAVGQIDGNIRRAIATDLPERAPAYFFIDIQPDQMAGFLKTVKADPAVTGVQTAPMLRGIITKINGLPARQVAPHSWVLRGDRGVTFSARPPKGTKITAGEWWPPGYNGPPQISFAADEARDMGLSLGDTMTINILGRDITATITSFRNVDFASGGIGFVIAMDPAALAGAPHSAIATVYADPGAAAGIVGAVARHWPNITAISVQGAIDKVTQALSAIAAATSAAAGATLLTGFAVLIGAAAAGERARIYEAAVLKTLGASRARILASFALRAAILGAAAGVVALFAGSLGAWAVMRFVMQSPYRLEPGPAIAIVLGGILAVLLAGALFALRPLAARPARILRARD
ncbi:drug:proton antiporter [Defluviimonas sp. 20V17]|uniref:ABC transport system permease protein n=1 Tax=Allgaiera indica TaxID=765699 RepID=A0AAN4UNW9_9RHOB|nr:FtsX-like permease family protein [Allgaiera indica]KDB02486.1 drug:proton antiporter [Defluviimonas sp. 20V17]GHD98751.1 drug:proton antiporter [Allgaiera indica]SDW06974.1 putative ABC transport system permease protein [Allgaiera indica]